MLFTHLYLFELSLLINTKTNVFKRKYEDLKNNQNVAKYIIKNVANLGCNGTLLNAMKYFPGEAPTCWEDFVVKMLITGKYEIKNKQIRNTKIIFVDILISRYLRKAIIGKCKI